MELTQIVPWGRNMSEYLAMFALNPQSLRGRIVGVGDGPASFNAECFHAGLDVTSVDPLYQFSADEIAGRIEAAYPEVLAQVTRHKDDFNWDHIASPEALAEIRMQAMQIFLQDFAHNQDQRYINAALPQLPFADKQFDLALCSHLLFLYSDRFDMAFHIKACHELCRIAAEVRIYPLVTLDNSPSPYVDAVIESLRFVGLEARIHPVDYQFQRGAGDMLLIQKSQPDTAA